MERSIKYNFTFNLINTLVGILFPIVTFPYIARILDPDGIGLINFYQSIISYITLFSSLGIALYSVRELSRIRDDKDLLSQYFTEIITLHLILVFVGYIVVGILCLTVEQIHIEYKIFLILSVSIFFNAIGVTWFYQAIEDFKFITIRSVTIKILSAIGLFLFVKTKDDLITYAFILLFSDAGNNVLNLLRLRIHINLHNIKIKQLKIFRHIKPALKIFSLNVIVSLYLQMSPLLLGFMTSNTVVGYFSAASRIQTALLSIVTALGTTLLPRMSYYFSTGDTKRFNETQEKGLSFIIMLTLPLVVGLIMTSDELIPIFAGPEFYPAIPTLKIISSTIFLIGISGIVGMQILYPQCLENIVIKATSLGAAISIAVSLASIPYFKQNGAAIGFLSAEFTVTVSMLIIGRKHLNYKFFNTDNLKVALSTAVMTACVYLVDFIASDSVITSFIIKVMAGIVSYFVTLALTRHNMVNSLKMIFLRKKRT